MAERTTDRPDAKDRPAERPPGDPSPNDPTDLSKPTWLGVLKRSLREFKEDNVTDWAGALTYYGVLSLFPAMIVLLSVFGQETSTIDTLTGIVKRLGPPSAVDTFAKPIQSVVQQKAAAGTLLGVGLLASLWSASAYVSAFIRASNAIYEVQEGRPFWKLRPLQIVITLLGVVLIALISLGLVVSGPLARVVGDAMGLGSTAVTTWGIVK